MKIKTYDNFINENMPPKIGKWNDTNFNFFDKIKNYLNIPKYKMLYDRILNTLKKYGNDKISSEDLTKVCDELGVDSNKVMNLYKKQNTNEMMDVGLMWSIGVLASIILSCLIVGFSKDID